MQRYVDSMHYISLTVRDPQAKQHLPVPRGLPVPVSGKEFFKAQLEQRMGAEGSRLTA